jgi:ubiquinone/menaquinone biosynthesis C-methylase UbiE
VESLHKWLEGSGLTVEFYGLDISPGLLDLAKSRLPHWQDRFFLGNALYWVPKEQFDYVCTAELGYVPRDRQQALFDHLFEHVVAPGGRLILGPFSEERDSSEMEIQLGAWGYTPSGHCTKTHAGHKDLVKRIFWFDKGGMR